MNIWQLASGLDTLEHIHAETQTLREEGVHEGNADTLREILLKCEQLQAQNFVDDLAAWNVTLHERDDHYPEMFANIASLVWNGAQLASLLRQEPDSLPLQLCDPVKVFDRFVDTPTWLPLTIGTLRATIHGFIRDEYGNAEPPDEWARRFGIAWKTIKRRIDDGEYDAHQVHSKSWYIHRRLWDDSYIWYYWPQLDKSRQPKD